MNDTKNLEPMGYDPKGAIGATKAPLQLIPAPFLHECAWVAKSGAAKYGAYNWRLAYVESQTYVGAIMRHLTAWQDGEDLDPESGQTHLAHVAMSCAILIDAQDFGTLKDNRPPSKIKLDKKESSI
jgi:hypothetical protein